MKKFKDYMESFNHSQDVEKETFMNTTKSVLEEFFEKSLFPQLAEAVEGGCNRIRYYPKSKTLVAYSMFECWQFFEWVITINVKKSEWLEELVYQLFEEAGFIKTKLFVFSNAWKVK